VGKRKQFDEGNSPARSEKPGRKVPMIGAETAVGRTRIVIFFLRNLTVICPPTRGPLSRTTWALSDVIDAFKQKKGEKNPAVRGKNAVRPRGAIRVGS